MEQKKNGNKELKEKQKKRLSTIVRIDYYEVVYFFLSFHFLWWKGKGEGNGIRGKPLDQINAIQYGGDYEIKRKKEKKT